MQHPKFIELTSTGNELHLINVDLIIDIAESLDGARVTLVSNLVIFISAAQLQNLKTRLSKYEAN